MAAKFDSTIITSIENKVQRVVLNRPTKKNAITKQMYRDLTTILKESANNEAVRALVITGNGDFYSSGNDFVSYLTESNGDIQKATEVKELVDALILYPKLLIAIVNGPAIGIAATTLALFDIVYASDTAYLLTPFCKLGLSPEGCSSYTFPRIMGPSRASELLFLGEKLTAKEAALCGLVSKVYVTGAVDKVWSHINKIASLSKASLASTKRLLRRWNQKKLLEVNEEEIRSLTAVCEEPDFMERALKFMSRKSKI